MKKVSHIFIAAILLFAFALDFAAMAAVAPVGEELHNEVSLSVDESAPASSDAQVPGDLGAGNHCQIHCGHSHCTVVEEHRSTPLSDHSFFFAEEQSLAHPRFVAPEERPPNA